MRMITFVVGLVLLAAGAAFCMNKMQTMQWFSPAKEWEQTPFDAGLAHEEISLKTPDGTCLSAWYIPCARTHRTLLYMHGTQGNISHRLPCLQMFHQLGLAIMIFDYRGYGKSEGQPSESGVYEDARTAYDYLMEQRGVSSQNIILFGESLGGAIAIDLASRVPARALITNGTFTSAAEMAALKFPILGKLPTQYFLSQKFDSLSKVAHISIPKFFIHARNDETVPFTMAQKLFMVACPPKEFIPRSGNHGDHSKYPEIFAAILRKI